MQSYRESPRLRRLVVDVMRLPPELVYMVTLDIYDDRGLVGYINGGTLESSTVVMDEQEYFRPLIEGGYHVRMQVEARDMIKDQRRTAVELQRLQVKHQILSEAIVQYFDMGHQ